MSCVVGGCNVVATEHGRYGLSCPTVWELQSVQIKVKWTKKSVYTDA